MTLYFIPLKVFFFTSMHLSGPVLKRVRAVIIKHTLINAKLFFYIHAHVKQVHYRHKHKETRVKVCAVWVLWKQVVGVQSSRKHCSYSLGESKMPSQHRDQKITWLFKLQQQFFFHKWLCLISQNNILYFSFFFFTNNTEILPSWVTPSFPST